MLNNDDIQTLIEALDALESKSTRDGLLGSMLGMMLLQDKDEARRQADEEMKKAEHERDAISEKIILLKAKLIQMKDKSAVDEAKDFLKRGG